MTAQTDAERIAVLEDRTLRHDKILGEINGKLDELLALKAKGMGAFWLGSALFGILLTVLANVAISWFNHG